MNKAFPLLETLIHYHSKEYHDSKLISVFHWRMIQNCFSVKHTNGEVNELIDWGNAMEGLGVTIIEYENVDIRLHCTFENHNDKLQINMCRNTHALEYFLYKNDYLQENGDFKPNIIGSLIRKIKQLVSDYYDTELNLARQRNQLNK